MRGEGRGKDQLVAGVVAGGIASLPENLFTAVAGMEESKLVRETLGDHVFEYFIRNKRAEWQQYKAYVSPWEIERSLPIL